MPHPQISLQFELYFSQRIAASQNIKFVVVAVIGDSSVCGFPHGIRRGRRHRRQIYIVV